MRRVALAWVGALSGALLLATWRDDPRVEPLAASASGAVGQPVAPKPVAAANTEASTHNRYAHRNQRPAQPGEAPPRPGSTLFDSSEVVDTEICGFGMVKVAATDPDLQQALNSREREALLDQVEALMQASGDERTRAAGHLLGAQARGSQRLDRIDRLARLAAGSQDPAVYAMALEGCRAEAGSASGPCRLLGVAQWAHQAPDNLLPWLEQAALAQQTGDAQAQAEALRHAALATSVDAYEGLLPQLVLRAIAQGLGPPARAQALRLAWSVQTVWSLLQVGDATAACNAEALALPERQQQCQAIAKTLARNKLRLPHLGMGLAIGSSRNWSAARLQAWEQIDDAVSEVIGLKAVGLDLSCEGVARLQGWLRHLEEHGELGALRAALTVTAPLAAPAEPQRKAGLDISLNQPARESPTSECARSQNRPCS